MKKTLIAVLAFAASCGLLGAKVYTLRSPDGSVTVSIDADSKKGLSYSVSANGVTVLAPSKLRMSVLSGVGPATSAPQIWGESPAVLKARTETIREEIEAPLYKQKNVKANYSRMTLAMKGGWGVEFRAYADGGVAYRFLYDGKSPCKVADEVVQFNFDRDYQAWYPYSNRADYLTSSFENVYEYTPMSAYDTDRMAFLPVLVDLGDGGKVFITESDVEAYPGMYVRYAPENGGFKAVFPRYPAGDYTFTGNRLQERVGGRREYIAEVGGKRAFPWRIVRHVTDDRKLPVDDMVCMTASPNRIGDTSWIAGGRSAWDWWNDWGLSGVDFKAGVNTETYKYYADFCADNGLEFFIMDEGWSPPKGGDIMEAVPEIDLREIVEYASSKGVKVFLWAVANILDDKLEEACRTYSEMGFAGFKVDFIDRQDQLAVERIYRIAETAARYGLMINYHGIYKPTGLSRTYPNVINYEGVWGLEQLKWSPRDNTDMPTYDVTVPYIRMAAGPMDYTQGAMRNAVKANYQPVYREPMSQGTRAHQVAAYVVFDSPMAMLCDAPTNYLRERETLDYIAAIPSVFDRMEILQGRVGEYIVTAREKDGVWYVGGMTGWDARTTEIGLGFLGAGRYEAVAFIDGVNADKVASDYRVERLSVDRGSKLSFPMASGGGFAMILTPVE